jgi:hypothetical protein
MDLINLRKILPLKIKLNKKGLEKIVTLVEKKQAFGKRKIKQIFSLVKAGEIDREILDQKNEKMSTMKVANPHQQQQTPIWQQEVTNDQLNSPANNLVSSRDND